MDHLDFACEFKLAGTTAETAGDIAGYGSMFGEVDQGGDIVMPGAFKASLADWRTRKSLPAMLWQHNPDMPIGVWTDVAEDEKGLKVSGRLALGVGQADEARILLMQGAVKGLSIGYRTQDAVIDKTTGVRRIKKLDLWEVSLVTFPMLRSAGVTTIKTAFDANAWERAFRDEGLTVRESKLATSVARKMACRDGAPIEPTPRDVGVDLLMTLRAANERMRS